MKKIKITETQEYKLYFWHMVFLFTFLGLFFLSLYTLQELNIFPTSISLIDFMILVLAIFRTTRLFVYDGITNFLRDFFKNRNDEFSQTISELLYCPWCTGVWVSLFLSFLYFITPFSWYFLFILALAGIVGILQVLINYVIRVTTQVKNELKKH